MRTIAGFFGFKLGFLGGPAKGTSPEQPEQKNFSSRVWLGKAAMPGPEHYRRRINRQDQVLTFRWGKWLFGAIADGCSGSRMSEAGAAELVHAAIQAMYWLVSAGATTSEMPHEFQKMMEQFIIDKVRAFPAGREFAENMISSGRKPDMSLPENHLAYLAVDEMFQATLLAVCVHEDEGGIVMVRGDGSVYLDGSLCVFDYNDMPPYFSYVTAIAGNDYPGKPEDLVIKTVEVPPDFSQLAVTTDGWPWELQDEAFPFGRWRMIAFDKWLRDVNQRREKEGKPPISGEYGWSIYNPEQVNDLARKLVKDHSDAFTDDISAIVIEREVYEHE